MPVFTVEAVEQVAAGTGDKGPWTRQKVSLNSDGTPITASLFCNQYTPVPTVGSTLEGDIKPPKQEGWLPELALPRKGGGGGRGRSPEELRSIAMQASHKVAIDVARLAVDAGLWKPESPDQITDAVLKVGDRLYGRVQEVGS